MMKRRRPRMFNIRYNPDTAIDLAKKAQLAFRWRDAADLWYTAAALNFDEVDPEVFNHCNQMGSRCIAMAERDEAAKLASC